jgi:hypothetical protein
MLLACLNGRGQLLFLNRIGTPVRFSNDGNLVKVMDVFPPAIVSDAFFTLESHSALPRLLCSDGHQIFHIQLPQVIHADIFKIILPDLSLLEDESLDNSTQHPLCSFFSNQNSLEENRQGLEIDHFLLHNAGHETSFAASLHSAPQEEQSNDSQVVMVC